MILAAAAMMILGISAMAKGTGEIGSVGTLKFNPDQSKLGIVCKLIPSSVKYSGNGANIKRVPPASLMSIFVPSAVRYDKNGYIKLNIKNKEIAVGFIDLIKNDLESASAGIGTMNYNRTTVVDAVDATKAIIKNVISTEKFSFRDYPEQAGISETHLMVGGSTLISNVVDFEGDTSGKNSFIYSVETLNLEVAPIGPEYVLNGEKTLSMGVVTYDVKSKYKCNHDLGMF